MTTEQKAKAYDEAIERAKKWRNAPNIDKMPTYGNRIIEEIFPELKESEDEKIRKWCISHFMECFRVTKDNAEYQEYLNNKVIPWLEKQGNKEQIRNTLLQDNNFRRMFEKPQCKSALKAVNEEKVDNASKVEPKFHEGDWVVDEETGCIYQIKNCVENVTNHKFGFDLTNGGYIGSDETNHYHRWSLSDAKDGDVLVCNINKAEIGGDVEKLPNIVPAIFIYEKVETNKDYIHSYCHLYNGSSLGLQNTMYYNKFVFDIYPATKEQRDTLFAKIEEADNEWNPQKSELRKIENQPIEEVNDEDYGIDGLYHAQRILKKTLGEVEGYQTDDGILDHKAAITAVKKLREQKPAEWSEEDERKFRDVIRFVEQGAPFKSIGDHYTSWLKSLRPQNHWKPSEEQLQTLEYYMHNLIGNKNKEILFGLYEQLKKL